MDRIIMQIDPGVNLKHFAAGEGPASSQINARDTSSDTEQEQDWGPQYSGAAWLKKAKMSGLCSLK